MLTSSSSTKSPTTPTSAEMPALASKLRKAQCLLTSSQQAEVTLVQNPPALNGGEPQHSDSSQIAANESEFSSSAPMSASLVHEANGVLSDDSKEEQNQISTSDDSFIDNSAPTTNKSSTRTTPLVFGNFSVNDTDTDSQKNDFRWDSRHGLGC